MLLRPEIKMKKLSLFVTLVLMVGLANAHEADFAEAKRLVGSGASCANLTQDQLEIVGDYYMEQMHPGAAHETMDAMMGGEGSESLRQMHIQIARASYCNESGSMNTGGGMMSGMMTGNFMQSGFWGIQGALYFLLLIGLVILVFLGIAKLLKDLTNEKPRRHR